MKIAICISLDFTNKIEKVANQLTEQGHEVIIPQTAEMIINGEVSLRQIIEEKERDVIFNRTIKQNTFKYYFKKIKEVDAILVLNYDKKDIKGYIGGNTFLEMGFAYILGKRIFLLNDIPDLLHKDEIKAMQPIILNGDLGKIER